ncbi:MAG: HAD family hydrolase [Pseudomonadota bacterium]
MSETRIAMWSGPRNLSTALMRSFGARGDCVVSDEPFFAPFLAATGIDHPMREEVLAHHETDPQKAAAHCLAPLPKGVLIHYQKQMCHHMLPSFDMRFMEQATNAFLIRDPEEVAASYEAKRERPTGDDLGFNAQNVLYDRVADRIGESPPVVDAADIIATPEDTLKRLCTALKIPWDAGMLSWPPGRRETDGVWAAHWYGAVEASTGFAPPVRKTVQLSDHGKRLAAAARPVYEKLKRVKI